MLPAWIYNRSHFPLYLTTWFHCKIKAYSMYLNFCYSTNKMITQIIQMKSSSCHVIIHNNLLSRHAQDPVAHNIPYASAGWQNAPSLSKSIHLLVASWVLPRYMKPFCCTRIFLHGNALLPHMMPSIWTCAVLYSDRSWCFRFFPLNN